MKRVLLLSICIVAGSALVAMADANSGNYPSWMTAVRTADALPGRDLIEYSLNPAGFPAGVSLAVLEGTWSSADGAIALNKSTSYTTWRNATGPDAPLSHVQLPYNTGQTFTRTGSADASYYNAKTLLGSWFTSDAYGVLSPVGTDPDGGPLATALASMYVTSGKMVNFSGVFGWVGAGQLGGQVTPANFGSVPEPGTLVLLATGLIGAIAMWVRRRRA